MNKKNNIDPIDEALRFIYLDSSAHAENDGSSEELKKILKAEYAVKISENDKKSMIEKLFNHASAMSFGELLVSAMDQKHATSKSLAAEMKVSESLIEELKSDAVFTNNVPVMFVKSILQALNVPFKKAEEAILKTFELLKSQSVIEQVSIRGLQPAFRKGYYASRETSAWSGNIPESRDLFENEEALKKYLARLNELMNK